MPILVERFRTISLASTGADRAIPVATGGLRIKPANAHHGGIDCAVCRGAFYLPDDPPVPPELTEAIAKRRSEFGAIGIETIRGDALDSLMIRIDAAFSTAWTAMNRSVSRTRPEGFGRLRTQFEQLCGAAGGDILTAARYCALHAFVEVFGPANSQPVAVRECLYGVRQTISVAERSERFRSVSPESITLSLNETDEEALAQFV